MSSEGLSKFPTVEPVEPKAGVFAKMVDGVFHLFSKTTVESDEATEVEVELDYPYPDRDTFVKDLNELLAITAHGPT